MNDSLKSQKTISVPEVEVTKHFSKASEGKEREKE